MQYFTGLYNEYIYSENVPYHDDVYDLPGLMMIEN